MELHNKDGDDHLICHFCPCCMLTIETGGHPARDMLFEICACYFEDGSAIYDVTKVDKNTNNLIEYLEQKRYVKSTEISRTEISIIPRTSVNDTGLLWVCWC